MAIKNILRRYFYSTFERVIAFYFYIAMPMCDEIDCVYNNLSVSKAIMSFCLTRLTFFEDLKHVS